MGRPVSGVGSCLDGVVGQSVLAYRLVHPLWSAATIWNALVHKDGYLPSDLASVRTFGRYLSAHKLSKNYEKNRSLQVTKSPDVCAFHECWQMDDKGPELYPGVGYVGMINIKDQLSTTYVQSFGVPLAHTRSRPTMSDYQCALRLAFAEFGMLQRLQADHGSNFHENRSKSPFPTPLHLWLLGLGMDLVWARIYRPTDQAVVERSHQTVHNQIHQTLPFKDMNHFQQVLNDRRYCLNYQLPAAKYDGQAPLKALPEAKHSKRFYNPINEQQMFDNQRIMTYLKGKEWFRKVSTAKTISIGGKVYYIKQAKPNTEIRITVSTEGKNLLFYDVKELLEQIPIKGISYHDLIDTDFIKTLKSMQLEIPIDGKISEKVHDFMSKFWYTT